MKGREVSDIDTVTGRVVDERLNSVAIGAT